MNNVPDATAPLAALALAATEAEEAYKSQKLTAAASKLHHEEVSAYCAFRAAATPSVVLALICERDRARVEAEAYRRGWTRHGEHWHDRTFGMPICRDADLLKALTELTPLGEEPFLPMRGPLASPTEKPT